MQRAWHKKSWRADLWPRNFVCGLSRGQKKRALGLRSMAAQVGILLHNFSHFLNFDSYH